MLTLGPSVAEPTLVALEQMGMLDQVKHGSFHLSPEVLRALSEGRMLFAIDQQQYLQGYMPIQLLQLKSDYGIMPTGTIRTGPSFVTQENAAQAIELSAQEIR